MQRPQLVRKLAKKLDGVSYEDLRIICDTFEETIIEQIKEGEEISFGGVMIYTEELPEREVTDPRNGNKIFKPKEKKVKVRVKNNLKLLFKNED